MKPELTFEIAKQMYESGIESLKQFAVENFQELGKKPLPMNYKELEQVRGYYITSGCDILQFNGCYTVSDNRNVFRTKAQAEASIALAQLSQLMYVWNEGWEPDFFLNKDKYIIGFINDDIVYRTTRWERAFLVFRDYEIRNKFAETFKDLIMQAAPLL